MDELNDARLLTLAVNRMSNFNSSSAIPAEQVYKELGISQDDFSACDEVEIE